MRYITAPLGCKQNRAITNINCFALHVGFQLIILTVSVLLLPIASSSESRHRPQGYVASKHIALSPSAAVLDDTIQAAARYLEQSCSPDGEFTYQIDTLSGEKSDSYNVVRHAGAMYSLGMLRRTHDDPLIDATLVNAASYMRKHYVGPGIRPGQLAVWSKPLPQPSNAELGATGLGLVALIEARRVDSRSLPMKQLQALGRFLLFLQRRDGSFIHKYNPRTGPEVNWQSLYYPGEAALGLISLYEVDHSRKWLHHAAKALAYLARSHLGGSPIPPDHWALIAMARLLPYCDREACGVSRTALLQYAVGICNELLGRQEIDPDNPALDGAFDRDGRVAPTATSIEGLLAGLELLSKENPELCKRIRTAGARGVRFLIQAQITSGPYAGGMPRAYIFNTENRIPIRIDYVQHSLSAWINYRRLGLDR